MIDSTLFQPETHYQDVTVAESYDSMRFTTRSGQRGDRKEKRAFTRLLDRLGAMETALDVPCGTGRMTEVLLNRGLTVTGCDISVQMIAQAQAKLRRFSSMLEFLQGDLRSLDLPQGAFDLVTCVRLFGHFASETRIEMLREMARVSRGPVIVQYFVQTPLTRFKRFVKNRILKSYPGVGFPAAMRQIECEVQNAGLQIHTRSHSRWYYSEEVFFLLGKR